ncbi:hypothetical protein PTSG_00919 [Salpingoeca rosetta]|uniref:Cytochrome b-c1 complex subunit 2, mitochondrial n=1 Tax=Salpingoeca rosetta (strain ATCC 50818 / BSB-021) TaxID=946362 RepID=F2TXV7_SALR5|nr:uncharacterized protein PTSG_00919 [Salpingoeca rosetta]EGD76216.1 hypothetical protein PTSG_00919 [Salpingoeca rosetta]|eukprot:XP_004998391.1 hypothetical protein PTSG_00919 [Salpingoeca rosetta]
MASTVSRTAGATARRFLGTAAPAAAAKDVQVTKLANGVTVVSQEPDANVTTISVTVGAGTQNETFQTSGVTHYLRNLAFQSTASRSALRITREAEANGSRYTAESGRDFISYNAYTLPQSAEHAADVLTEVVGAPNLHDWEVPKQNARVARDLELAAETQELVLLDDAHRVAFRNTPLGRPVLCPASRVGRVSGADVRAFRDQFFSSDRIVVAAAGISHDALVQAAEQNLANMGPKKAALPASQYFGGESVTPADIPVAHVALGFRGASVQSNDLVAALVIRNLFGGDGSSVKWSTDASASKVGAAVGGAASGPFKVSGFAAAYETDGLVGVHMAVQSADVNACVTNAAAAVKEIVAGNISEEDFARAKAHTRRQLIPDTHADATTALAAQHLYNAASVDEQLAKLQSLTLADVKKVAQALGGSRPFVAARGPIDNLPYLDTLGF